MTRAPHIYAIRATPDGAVRVEKLDVNKETPAYYYISRRHTAWGHPRRMDKAAAHLTAESAVHEYVQECHEKAEHAEGQARWLRKKAAKALASLEALKNS